MLPLCCLAHSTSHVATRNGSDWVSMSVMICCRKVPPPLFPIFVHLVQVKITLSYSVTTLFFRYVGLFLLVPPAVGAAPSYLWLGSDVAAYAPEPLLVAARKSGLLRAAEAQLRVERDGEESDEFWAAFEAGY